MKKKLGTQICADLYGCKRNLLDDPTFIKEVFKKSIENSGLKEIETKIYRFNPHGITGFTTLTTSHISIHTWPEYNYVCVDVFACDARKKVERAVKTFIEELKPTKINKAVLKRGYITKPK